MPRRSTRRHTTGDLAVAPSAVATAIAGVATVAAVAGTAVAVAVLPALAAGPAGASTPSSTITTSTSTSSSTAKAAKPTPGAEYAAAIKAARGHGVHFHSTATENGTTINVIGDTGATSGAQTITVKKGSTLEHVQVLRVGATGYVKANNTALHNLIGLTSAESSKYAGRWMYFPASNTALDALIGGLLEKDVSSELQMSGPYTYAVKRGGRRPIGHRDPRQRRRREWTEGPTDPLRTGERSGPSAGGGDEPRTAQEFVRHPWHSDVLELGRKEGRDPTGARRLVAQDRQRAGLGKLDGRVGLSSSG